MWSKKFTFAPGKDDEFPVKVRHQYGPSDRRMGGPRSVCGNFACSECRSILYERSLLITMNVEPNGIRLVWPAGSALPGPVLVGDTLSFPRIPLTDQSAPGSVSWRATIARERVPSHWLRVKPSRCPRGHRSPPAQAMLSGFLDQLQRGLFSRGCVSKEVSSGIHRGRRIMCA